jgi:hypothetical protein
MADKYLLESGDGLLLEDGSSFLLLEAVALPGIDIIPAVIDLTGAALSLFPEAGIDIIPAAIELTGSTIELEDVPGIDIIPAAITLTGSTLDLPNIGIDIIPATIQLRGKEFYAEINEPEIPECVFIIDLLPPALSGHQQEQSARLTIGETAVKIRSFVFEESENDLVPRVDVEIADVSQRSLFTSTAAIKFELGTVIDGVMTWETLIEGGELLKAIHNMRTGAHTFTFTGQSAAGQKLNTTAEQDMVIYDPLKLSLDVSDFEVVKDNFGRTYTTQLIPIANLKLQDLLDRTLIDECGFTDIQINLPNYPLSRVDFRGGEPFMNAVGDVIAMYEPDVQEIGDTLYIRDTTIPYDAAFPTPADVAVNTAVQIGVATELTRVDCLELIYSEWRRNHDFTETRVLQTTELVDVFGRQVRTTTTTTYIDYFRSNYPDNPIATEISRIVREVWAGPATATLIERSTEVFTYDSFGRSLKRDKDVLAWIPELTGDYALTDLRIEEEIFRYRGHPFQRDKVYVSKRELGIEGLIVIDTANQQLGQDWKRDYSNAYRSGNLNEDQTLSFDIIQSIDESQRPVTRDVVNIRRTDIDHLTEIVTTETGEERAGDVAIPSLVHRQGRMFIFKTIADTRNPAEYIETFNAGELPMTNAIPLAVRVLRNRQQRPVTMAIQVIGCELALSKGAAFRGVDADGNVLGVFSVRGRTLTGQSGAYFTNLVCKQIG